MAEKTIIGIDVGTQGTKAALFSKAGVCLAVAFAKSRLYQPGGGIVEEDPEYQLLTVCQTIRECVRKARIWPKSVAAIGIDGQMAGVLGIGKDGRSVTVYDSWLDTRCGRYIDKMQNQAGSEVLSKTGNAPSFNHGPKILWWMHERKGVFKSIRSFVQPGGYVAMRLCGLDGKSAFIDRTYLHFSGFADNKRNKWDIGLCKKFHLDPAKLPRIVAPSEVIGELTGSMARRCSLPAGTPVIAGCGDTAASFLACGATGEGVCVDVAGTASVFASTTKTFRADKRHNILGCGQAATPGLWHPYAYINGGGMNLEWFRREIANRGRRQGKSLVSFDELNKMAQAIGFNETGPLFVPHLGGRVSPGQPYLRGAWVGLDWSQSLAHLYRAVLEGVALEYGIYRNVLGQLYPKMKLKDIRITGGGERSVIWNRIKAAVLGMPVVQIVRSEGAPMGSAMLAGVGAGLFKSVPAVANQWVKKGARYSPNKKLYDYYRRRVKKYEELLKLLNEFSQPT